MVESKSNNKLWIGLAAAGALIGAALLFHWATSSDEDGEDIGGGSLDTEKLAKDLKAAKLSEVQKSP